MCASWSRADSSIEFLQTVQPVPVLTKVSSGWNFCFEFLLHQLTAGGRNVVAAILADERGNVVIDQDLLEAFDCSIRRPRIIELLRFIQWNQIHLRAQTAKRACQMVRVFG